MSLASTLYGVLFKRSSTMALTIIGGAFIFERTFDLATDKIFRAYNKGKLWDDIKHNYEK
ncbi:cytochrome b-c1 complex subunit 9 [Copidosoma floridanum]|uniref:cytochrome b-c1 complex subunit 9 n=1 Tax=Copidosoma floridanum TaxID=29053 RepID=UPI0006C9B5DC|nr:cytochrome b-c1 complex subunit 9 [Copidosoma floridanum]XP_014211145.1 cytochrome b-c1 complex subunit 9 [Copidosoma floridanum]